MLTERILRVGACARLLGDAAQVVGGEEAGVHPEERGGETQATQSYRP